MQDTLTVSELDRLNELVDNGVDEETATNIIVSERNDEDDRDQRDE